MHFDLKLTNKGSRIWSLRHILSHQ